MSSRTRQLGQLKENRISITSRKWIGRIAIAIAATTVLASCSSSPLKSASGGSTVVNWWSFNPDLTSGKPFFAAFEKEYPNITVKFRFIDLSSYPDTLRLALKSDSGPDVFGVSVGALTTQLAPLTIDLGPLATKNIGADWKTQLSSTDDLAVNGKQVGLPWMITGAGLLWYNKGIFEKVGVKPPTTLAEWKKSCAKIQATGVICLVQGAKDAWVNLDEYQVIANQITPGTFYEAMLGKVKFDSPNFIKAFDVWKSLWDSKIIQPGALGMNQYPDANDIFSKGKAAMIAFGTWANDFMTHTALNAGAAANGDQFKSQIFLPLAFPDVVGGAKETGRLFGGPDLGWAISAKSKNKDAAFTLVQWLTASKTGQQVMAKTLQIPALKSVPVDNSDVVSLEQKAVLDDQAKQMSNLIGPRQIANADVEAALGQALSAVASGQMSSAAAAKSVQAAIDASR